MNQDEIFTVLKEIIKEVLPMVNENDITINKALIELGANSIDRSEIVINAMARLNINIPAHTLANVKNIEGLVNALYEAQPH